MAISLRMTVESVLLVLLYLGHVTPSLADEDTVILEMSMKHCDVDEIFVYWNISDQFEVDYYTVTNQKKDSQAITNSGALYNATDGYLIEDLVPDTEYEVCMTVTLIATDQCETVEGSCTDCKSMSTIVIIRQDSLIALILTLSVILLLVLIGFICWFLHKRRLQGCDDDDDSEHGSDESKQPILLSVPSGNGPRRSVDFEDQDIPYIDEHGEPISKDSSATHV